MTTMNFQSTVKHKKVKQLVRSICVQAGDGLVYVQGSTTYQPESFYCELISLTVCQGSKQRESHKLSIRNTVFLIINP